MTDDTNTPKAWDIEQFRGVRRHSERKKDWEPQSEEELELILGATQQIEKRTGNSTTRFDKRGPSLFWLALKTAILTVLTLGFYRFWMVTRLRRHYWNSIRIQGDPLEYTGTGLEKIMGFLVALIILAVYLGLVNVALMFIGLSYFNNNPLALQISIFAAMPLFFFAAYRGRRYVMARTRWRGIRFGMDNGATGYTLWSIWYTLLTAITGGLLHPYAQFKLTKYMTDRTYFGDLRFHQNGSWAGLFAYWVWLYVVAGLVGLAIWGMMADIGNPSTTVIGGVIFFVGYMMFFVLFMRYETVVFRYMWSNRALGEATFQNDIAPGKIIGVYVYGTLLVGLCTILVIIALLLAGGVAAALILGPDQIPDIANYDWDQLASMSPAEGMQSAPAAILGAVALYLILFAVPFAFSQIFIVRPILQRKTEAMVIHNVGALTASRQRAHDHAAEAGGFADALGVDVGAGI